MLPSEHDVNRILLEADNSAMPLRQLYQLYKSQHKKVSFSYLCRRTGIPSKGYLAFVMSGKRRLNVKYWSSVCEAFKLNGYQTEMLQLLLELDAEPSKRPHYDQRMQSLKARLVH